MNKIKVVSALVMVVGLLAGCDKSSGGNGGLDSLRPAGQPTEPATVAAPAPTAVPQIGREVQTVVVESTVVVSQPVEVTREVVVVVTATPEPGIEPVAPAMTGNEEPQPCPAKLWKRGRCVATQAQIDAWASETK